MTDADRVHSTPRGKLADITAGGLHPCDFSRARYPTASARKAIRRLRRPRKRASAEIDRLIAFLDQSDEYVMTELEDDDDREDVGDTEPDLGSLEA